MREFINDEIEDIECRIWKIVKDYDPNWQDRYFEEAPNALNESGISDDLDDYNRLVGERTALYKVLIFLQDPPKEVLMALHVVANKYEDRLGEDDAHTLFTDIVTSFYNPKSL